MVKLHWETPVSLPKIALGILQETIITVMVVGPKVPAAITEERERRRLRNSAASSDKSREAGHEQVRAKQMFDPTKSVNDELKKEMLANIRPINDRFE